MDLINFPRKRKKRNITHSLFVLIEFTDPPSCCFHFVFITAAQMVAGAILHHDQEKGYENKENDHHFDLIF